jgi:hypothetical protein
MNNPAQSDDVENVEGEAVPPEPVSIDESEVAEGTEEFVPKGAMVFALVLIGGYIIYYFLIWSEIVLLRGGS